MPGKGKGKKGRKKQTVAKAKSKPKSSGGGSVAQSIGSSIGSALGSALGGAPGGALGSTLGRAAGGLFRKITGFGDYKVTSNSLSAPAMQDSLPQFTKSGRGTRLVHREYLTDVVTSAVAGAYSLTKYSIQPGLYASFPWLSSVGEQFEEYEINGMIYEFKSNSYDALASTNTASGTVVMTTQYNVLRPDFPNKQTMEQYEFTCSGKPSINIMHPIECSRSESPTSVLSTRAAPITTGDLRLYDFANFYLATVGMQGTSVNVGELWVSYDITFYKPRLGQVTDISDHWQLGPFSSISTSTAGWFGSAPILAPNSDFGSSLDVKAGQVITIPSSYTGNFMVAMVIGVTSSQSWSAVTFTTSSSVTGLNVFGMGYGSSAFSGYPGVTGSYTSTQLMFTRYFTCVAGGTITLGGGTSAGSSITTADLFVFGLPSNLV
jgi:hypothetical protein